MLACHKLRYCCAKDTSWRANWLILGLRAGNFSTSSSRSDYYEDLGLDQNADSKKIKESYYSLSKQFHPDLNAGNPEAAQKFHAISEAYSVLGDPRLRRRYDRNTLGRSFSAVDTEMAKHTFEGDKFVQGRASFREEFSEDIVSAKSRDKSSPARGKMDNYVNLLRGELFAHDQRLKARVASDKNFLQHNAQSERVTRQKPSPGINPHGSSRSSDSSGSGFFIIAVILVVLAAIKLLS